MEECPQCGKKLETPSTRLVQDSCGHKKCRVCLLEDETKCKQCNKEEPNNSLVINCPTSVITFQNHNELRNNNEDTKTEPVPSTNNVESNIIEDDLKSKSDEATKRTYHSLVIPNYITINATAPTYKCELCGKTFNTKWHIKYHQYCNGVKKPLKCHICLRGFISKTHLEAHMVTHTGTKDHMCSICKKTFAERSKLVRHQVLHTNEKPFTCQECGKNFKSKESLKLHTRIHKGEKPFKCDKCSAEFNNSSNLRKHEATHSKEKLHMCDQCGKRFKLKWALTVHHRIHLHLRPHKCLNCPKAFINAKDLHRHELIHSDVKAYSCGICGIGFRRKDNLERHMKNTHPGKKVPPIKSTQSKALVKKSTPEFADNPNAINVIKAPPCDNNASKKPESKVSVINAPLKLAFKTSAFKSYYNIHRNYEPPNDTDPINIYEKILRPHSPQPTDTSEQHSPNISTDIINQFKNKPINYETSFEQSPHAIIKNIKFKLPANYTNIRSTKSFSTVQPLEPVPNVNADQELQSNEQEYIELKPAKTSVIVNSSSDLHWRRRTVQTLYMQHKSPEDDSF